MLRGKLPSNVKAVINSSGLRIEGEALTPFVLEHALNNRDQFNLIYVGDSFEPAGAPAAAPGVQEPDPNPGDSTSPRYTESDLKRMKKDGLLRVCAERGIVVEGDPLNAELVEMILVEEGV